MVETYQVLHSHDSHNRHAISTVKMSIHMPKERIRVSPYPMNGCTKEWAYLLLFASIQSPSTRNGQARKEHFKDENITKTKRNRT
jgi:hypothetical protein